MSAGLGIGRTEPIVRRDPVHGEWGSSQAQSTRHVLGSVNLLFQTMGTACLPFIMNPCRLKRGTRSLNQAIRMQKAYRKWTRIGRTSLSGRCSRRTRTDSTPRRFCLFLLEMMGVPSSSTWRFTARAPGCQQEPRGHSCRPCRQANR